MLTRERAAVAASLVLIGLATGRTEPALEAVGTVLASITRKAAVASIGWACAGLTSDAVDPVIRAVFALRAPLALLAQTALARIAMQRIHRAHRWDVSPAGS